MLEPARSSIRPAARLWGLHLFALAPSLATTAFLATRPHGWPTLLLFLGLAVSLVLLDRRGTVRHAPPPGSPPAAFDVLLYAAAATHLTNVLLLVATTRRGP